MPGQGGGGVGSGAYAAYGRVPGVWGPAPYGQHPQAQPYPQAHAHPYPYPYPYGTPPVRSSVVAAPAGSGYTEQGRNGRQNVGNRFGEFFVVLGGILAMTIGTMLAAFVLASLFGLDATPEDGTSEQMFANPLFDLGVGLASLAVLTPVVLAAVRWCGHRPAWTLASVTGRLRWGWLWRCGVVAVAAIVLQTVVLITWSLFQGEPPLDEAPAGADAPDLAGIALSLLLVLALVPLQASAEEFVFRGWIPQFLGGFLKSPWWGIGAGSVLFAFAHGLGSWSGFAMLVYSAAWWGWVTVRTGGLEGVVALHTANNLMAFGISALTGTLADTQNAADAPWELFVVELVMAPLTCLALAKWADRRGVERRTGDGTPAAVAPAPALV
ncbi:lysostaphin resistance A-like protein [Streptomyces sp. BI20]|uniref:CPBP family intramembrane glutamic endopeptidase n=1 Tax=Streptomyces sp. BI20 TaxID=3403460 RepID=UPI003C78884D